eukprot:5619726-Ditylum_brightwellii.AAC.1
MAHNRPSSASPAQTHSRQQQNHSTMPTSNTTPCTQPNNSINDPYENPNDNVTMHTANTANDNEWLDFSSTSTTLSNNDNPFISKYDNGTQ